MEGGVESKQMVYDWREGGIESWQMVYGWREGGVESRQMVYGWMVNTFQVFCFHDALLSQWR